jgi:cell division cycle protein 20 (cofactor of APC complex)
LFSFRPSAWQVRSMNGHSARVSSLSWNRHILSSGSRDSTIVHHDVRVQQHQVATLVGHEQEVCGLKW